MTGGGFGCCSIVLATMVVVSDGVSSFSFLVSSESCVVHLAGAGQPGGMIPADCVGFNRHPVLRPGIHSRAARRDDYGRAVTLTPGPSPAKKTGRERGEHRASGRLPSAPTADPDLSAS